MAHPTQTRRRIATGAALMLFAGFLSIVPLQTAQAYIDPNSAGALYQFLFPLLIAAAGMFAALRRHIARLCSRLIGAVVTIVRGERSRPQSERDP